MRDAPRSGAYVTSIGTRVKDGHRVNFFYAPIECE